MPTKRLTGSEPNIQNLPIRTEQGRKIRDTFTEGRTIIEIDFTQLEMRLLARFEEDDDRRQET